MSGPRRVEVFVLGDSRSAQRAFNDLEGSARRGETQLERTSRKMQDAGRTISRAVTRFVVPAVAGTVYAYGQQDAALTKSTAIMGDVDAAMRQKMAETAREVSTQLNISAADASEAYYFLAAAGMDAAQAVAAMPQVARFAKAGMFDLARATDLATDAQSALGLAVDDPVRNLENLTRVTDVLVKANTLANASVDQFSTALTNKAGAALRLVNKDVEEGVAVLAAYADQGLKGEAAGEALNIVLRDLQRAALANKDAFDAAGIAVFDSNGNLNNMADIIAGLEGHLDGLSDAQRRQAMEALGFQDRSMAQLAALLGTSDAVREYEAQLRNAAGTTEQVANRQMEAFNEKLGQARQQLTNAGAAIGESFAPMVLTGSQAVAGLVERFTQLPDPVQQSALGMAALVAASGPALIVGGKLVGTYASLARSIQAAGGAKIIANRAFSAGVMGLTNLIGAINPVTVGLAAIAAGALLVKRNMDQQRDATVRASEGAETLAASLGIAYQTAEEAAAAAGDAAATTAESFAAANATMLGELRRLDREAAQARLIQVALDLMYHGATPEEAVEAVRQLQAAAGMPITITVDMVTDAPTQLAAIRTEADRLASNIGERMLWVGGANREVARSLGEVAGAFYRAGDQQQFLLTMAEINQAFRDGDLNGQQYSIAMGELRRGLSDVTGVDFSKFRSEGDALTSTLGALTKDGAGATDEMRHLAGAVLQLAEANNGELTPALIEQAEKLAESNRRTEAYRRAIDSGVDPVHAAALAARDHADAVEESGDASSDAADGVEEYGDATEDTTEKVEEAVDALRRHADELRAQHDPVFAFVRAADAATDAQDDFNEAVKEHGPESRQARDAAMRMAEAAIALQGAAGDAAGTFSGRLDPALRGAMELAGFTSKQIDAVEKELRDAARAGEAFRGDYRANVSVNAAAAERTLARLQGMARSLGGRITIPVGTNVALADGGIVAFADGGRHEQHHAQISAGSGPVRVWSEPETGGEAYIPLGPGKRARSVRVWEETGRLLGVYADGGVTGGRRTVAVGGAGSPDRDVLERIYELLAEQARQPRQLIVQAPTAQARDIADETLWALHTGAR